MRPPVRCRICLLTRGRHCRGCCHFLWPNLAMKADGDCPKCLKPMQGAARRWLYYRLSEYLLGSAVVGLYTYEPSLHRKND